MAGRPKGAENKDKPFRDALRMAIADAGDDRKQLRDVAEALIKKACEGDVPAITQIADRLDGKVPTPMAGADGESPIEVTHRIERVLVRPPDQDG